MLNTSYEMKAVERRWRVGDKKRTGIEKRTRKDAIQQKVTNEGVETETEHIPEK